MKSSQLIDLSEMSSQIKTVIEGVRGDLKFVLKPLNSPQHDISNKPQKHQWNNIQASDTTIWIIALCSEHRNLFTHSVAGENTGSDANKTKSNTSVE